MSRKTAREAVMIGLYQKDIHKEENVDVTAVLEDENIEGKKDEAYALEMVSTYHNNSEKVDSSIEEHLKNWKLSRIGKIDKAILRVAVTELLYVESIPPLVSVNEAVEMAKKYSDEEAAKFVNGVLAHFVK